MGRRFFALRPGALKGEMDARGLSSLRLAQRTGLSRKTVHEIARDSRTQVTGSTALLLLISFDLRPSRLLRTSEAPLDESHAGSPDGAPGSHDTN